jgi:hypothetical protein
MSPRTNGKPPTHQQRARSLADQLEDLPDEITGNHFIFPEKAKTTVEADSGGRVKVVSIPDAEEITRADHPKPDSRLPERIGGIATQLIAAVDKPPRLGALALLVALAAFAAWLRWGR